MVKKVLQISLCLAILHSFILQSGFAEFEMGENNITQSNPQTLSTYFNDVNMRISVIYDNAYYEKVLMPGKQLTAELDITNDSDEEKTISLIIVLYDASKMVSIQYFTDTLEASASDVFTDSVTVPAGSSVTSARLMVWNGIQFMQPYGNAVILTLESNDYFGDDYSVSQPLSSYSDAVGAISPVTDVDVFEYTAVKDGLYIFETYSDIDTYASLYAQGDMVNAIATDDNSGADENFRLSATLTAGQKYYLYIHGHDTGEYALKALYAIGNLFGTLSPVKYYDYEPEFNEAIESQVTLTTYDTNDFVATMHLKEWSISTSEYAAFDMTGIHGGTYLVSFMRPGYLTRYRKIVLNDNVIDLGSVTLLAGDVNGDGIINVVDSALLQSLYTKEYGEDSYNIAADLNGDKIINSDDLALLIPNLNKTANIYGENVNAITVTADLSGSILTISGTAAASSSVTVNVYQGSVGIFNESIAANSGGTYAASCNLSKAGTYIVVVTADNRAIDASVSVNY